MGVESDAFFELQNLVIRWSTRNQELLPVEIKRKKIGVTDSLQNSFRDKVSAKNTIITAEQIFDTSGRFVDMGVGKGNPIEGKNINRLKVQSNRAKIRKPKKWMRLMFARLNALQGAVGIKVMEKSVQAVKEIKGST
jgi:hypothetical protein